MMRKLRRVAVVAGKAICTIIILVYVAVVFPWLELYFWWTDDQQYDHKAWHYVKEYFRDIKEAAIDIWTNDEFWVDTFFR